MKKLYIKVLITLTIMFSIISGLNAQFLSGFYNGAMLVQMPFGSSTTPFRGISKPNTTEWDGPNPSNDDAYYPVLIVFVQFEDDPPESPHGSWPIGSAPIYLDSMIATEKNTNTNTPWWEKYNPNTEMISSQWMEISRGKFHVISPSGAFYVKLDSAYKYLPPYSNEQGMNKAIWDSITVQGLIDWRPYDQWTLAQNGQFYNRGDSIVDCIYKIHRSRNRGPMPDYDGWNTLCTAGGEWMVDNENKIKVHYSNSGFTVSFRGLKSQYIATCGHEHGHHTLTGNHLQNSRIAYGIGLDFFFSPYDMILSTYMTPRIATFGANNTLGDYSSRNNNLEGEILKVPIDSYTGECFLLSNRRKVSKWDRIMLGDSAQIEPYKDNSELGKGLYIYHLKNDVHFPQVTNDTVQDLECADGYWEWELKTTGGIAKLPYECFQSGPVWRVYQKKTVLYTNDPSTLGDPKPYPYNNQNYGNPNPWGDDISFFYRYDNSAWSNRWTTGKFIDQNCELNVDRLFTTDEDIIDNANLAGDRYDAWNVDYNEVFSPYSSPNTFSWSNDTTGIFIYFDSLSGNTANIKIYRATEFGGETDLAEILEATPPSRPMGLNVSVSDCYNDKLYPVLTWNHNMEPDMIQGEKPEKRYKVFRGYNQYGTVPEDYWEVADLLIYEEEQPVYMDLDAWNSCGGMGVLQNSIRYKIVAIDNTNWASVYSDFVSFSSEDLERRDNMGSLVNNNTVKKYEMSQNYPNPFNPVTKINYALPKQGFVTLKIYDITGREIQTLVNEVKQEGYYTVDFNGSHLSSGVYFYRIQSGNFVSVKRMVLIK
ncbi:MAG: T9SS type A sorting domain-containing protein [Candidatus Kapaibacterium sp.]